MQADALDNRELAAVRAKVAAQLAEVQAQAQGRSSRHPAPVFTPEMVQSSGELPRNQARLVHEPQAAWLAS